MCIYKIHKFTSRTARHADSAAAGKGDDMNLIDVHHLCKKYPGFALDDVNISLEEGYIMGFIGRNGAGKTTTMKAMLNLVHPESGTVSINGFDLEKDELEIKKSVGFVSGGVDFYPQTKLKKLTGVTKRFYADWAEDTYQSILKRFELDENKKVKELSAGMKVKYSLAIALSHHAKLLLLDEPTSGLDPAARDDLICLFQEFIEDGKHSILFSTHITSDLEKCADYITFIQEGQIVASSDKDYFIDSYKIISGDKTQLNEIKDELISYKVNSFGFTGMISTHKTQTIKGFKLSIPTLE